MTKPSESHGEWWYQLDSHAHYGPVSYIHLLALLTNGTISAQTGVRRSEQEDWRPFIEFANNRVVACQQFKLVCSQQWADLLPTSSDGIRHCCECNKNVYRCESASKLKKHALLGHCVALCSTEDDYEPLLGIPDEHDELEESSPKESLYSHPKLERLNLSFEWPPKNSGEWTREYSDWPTPSDPRPYEQMKQRTMSTDTPLPQARSANPRALVLLGTILRVCGFIYAFAFIVSGVVSVVCVGVVLRAQGPTMAHDVLGVWLGSTLFTGVGALASFAIAELITLAIRGVQAMEETVSLLRSMQPKALEKMRPTLSSMG